MWGKLKFTYNKSCMKIFPCRKKGKLWYVLYLLLHVCALLITMRLFATIVIEMRKRPASDNLNLKSTRKLGHLMFRPDIGCDFLTLYEGS